MTERHIPIVAVVGASDCSGRPHQTELAEAVGRALAEAGAILICGGRGGVMAAACRGAKSASGLTIGVLPRPTPTWTSPSSPA